MNPKVIESIRNGSILENLRLQDKSYINVENVLNPPRKPMIINSPKSYVFSKLLVLKTAEENPSKNDAAIFIIKILTSFFIENLSKL